MADEVFLSDDNNTDASNTKLKLQDEPKADVASNGSSSGDKEDLIDLIRNSEELLSDNLPKLDVQPKENLEITNVVKEKEVVDDTNLKQSDSGTLLSRGGEFQPEENISVNLNDSALNDLQTTSDIRFFICGSCKNNPILIGSIPKLLPCLHSFCEGCLQERYEKQKLATEGVNSAPRLKCPSCGQEFLVAANDRPTSGFLNNQFVIESTLTNKSNEPEIHQCTSCDDESDAQSYCMNCNEWLCDACVNAHQRVKVTKDHIIQGKSSCKTPTTATTHETPPAVKEKPLFCKVHPQEQLKLFCANCDKLTCRDCQLVEHKDHRYQFIDEAASKHREILKKLLQYLQINLGLLKETIVDVEKVSNGLGEQEKYLEAEIKKAFDSLTDSIKVRQDMLVKELKSLVVSKQALLAKQKKDLTQMRVILEHNHDFAEFAVKGGSNVALLYSRKVLGTRLHNLNSLKYRQRPLAFTDLKFSMDVDKLCSYFSKIGAVYSHEDMQRKIDHYNTKTTTSSTTPKTMALTSRTYSKSISHQNPIESMTQINKRILDTGSTPSTACYINLSKQGTLGLPGHQTIRSSGSSPSTYYNSHRLSSGSNQEMIVLSSSHPKPVSHNDHSQTKREFTSKYLHHLKDTSRSPKTPTHEKFVHIPNNYHHSSSGSNHRDYPRSLTTNTSHREHVTSWSKIEQSLTKNNTIDKLRKMVEGAAVSPLISQSVPISESTVSARSSGSDPGTTQAGRLSVNGMVLVKQEDNKSPDAPGYQLAIPSMQDDMRSESGFDESQNNEDYCGVCRNGGQLLCCDTCPKVYHLNCHIPALSDLPSDSWSCGLCLDIGTESRHCQKRRYSEEITEWELKLCEKIILNLFVHVDSLPFHHKVSKTQVPDYYKVISRPMDLMTVLTKLNPQHFEHYKALEGFISDIRLIFSNCFIYNSADSDVCKMGHRLESHFDALLQKYAPDANAYPDNEPKAKRRKENHLFS